MKAIHNSFKVFIFCSHTVFNTSKIQNESNSQLHEVIKFIIITVFNTSKIQNESNSQRCYKYKTIYLYCFQYFKDTK